ncbi:MAG: efflux RND transporter periplasmic adaptor subunit [Planctomycetes bacterium]|nr:efflux RND transporter periplasmic adaptor subunit [Planctomycetota bacterium]
MRRSLWRPALRISAILLAVVLLTAFAQLTLHRLQVRADDETSQEKVRQRSGPIARREESNRPLTVKVSASKPQSGGIARVTEQFGTIEAFDFADLYAKASGYVKTQNVDIGSKVAAGEVLVEIDAPEYEEALNEATATVAQSEAQEQQMQARLQTAAAELEATQSAVALATAELEKARSYLTFREIQYDRVKHLFELKSIDERLVDEKHEQRDAAEAALNSARAAIAAAKAQIVASQARVASAKADILEAQAKTRLAQAKESRARVFVNYLKIRSPYDGVVTRRSFHVGDFIRAADQGGATPLLTVARTDLMRVIVQIPERDVPYTDVGDPATVTAPEVLHREVFSGKVARMSYSEDRVTRTMRAEIDLKNPENRLRDGMYCRVSVALDPAARGFRLPSADVFVDRQTKQSTVYVVADGKAHKRVVQIAQDDGKHAEISAGLDANDLVVHCPPGELTDETSVELQDSLAER